MTESPYPPDTIIKLLDTPETYRLAELHILQTDLKVSRDAFELFFDKYSGFGREGVEQLIQGALFRDAVILLCSCFDPENKLSLVPEEVYGPPHNESVMAMYKDVLTVRDTFAAHNFGTLRQSNVGLICREENGELRFAEAACSNSIFAGWGPDHKPIVLHLVFLAMRANWQRIEDAMQEIESFAGKLSPAQLAELPDFKDGLPYPDEWRKGRKSFRRSKRARRTTDPARQRGKIISPTTDPPHH